MKGTITQMLEQRINRRGFLRGSGLVAIAVVGTAAFPSAAARGQEQAPEKNTSAEDAEQARKREEEESANASGGKKEQTAPADDGSTVTLKDDSGREYRVCPECGANMYRQDSTWTCENCGYAYTE